jgi:3-dehydroquinate dehydratase-2
MAKILLLSGPNLNLLGEREPDHYGTTTLAELVALASETAAKLGHDVEHVQSNHEGALIDAIQQAQGWAHGLLINALIDAIHLARGDCAAIIINAGAFTHYAYAITDALATFDGVKIEVHLSNPSAREQWRHQSVVAPVVDGTITGLRAEGYRLAVEAAAARLAERAGERS